MQVVVLHFDRSKEVMDSGQSEPINLDLRDPRGLSDRPYKLYDKSFSTKNTSPLSISYIELVLIPKLQVCVTQQAGY